jgi:hypothetical protein
MTDDQGKTPKKEFGDRLDKAKGHLQQSFPEIRQLVRTSNAVDVARKIIDPAQSIFRQFADDIQLKDLLAKAESIVANANRAFTKPVSKETRPTETVRDETPSNEPPAKKAGLKKTPSKATRLKKAVPKKALPKKKTRRPLKRVRTRA